MLINFVDKKSYQLQWQEIFYCLLLNTSICYCIEFPSHAKEIVINISVSNKTETIKLINTNNKKKNQ